MAGQAWSEERAEEVRKSLDTLVSRVDRHSRVGANLQESADGFVADLQSVELRVDGVERDTEERFVAAAKRLQHKNRRRIRRRPHRAKARAPGAARRMQRCTSGSRRSRLGYRFTPSASRSRRSVFMRGSTRVLTKHCTGLCASAAELRFRVVGREVRSYSARRRTPTTQCGN